MNKRVLYIASVYVHIRNFHFPYIKGLNDRGWDVHVACSGCATEIEGASRTIDVPFVKSFASVKNFRTALELRKIIRENHYDLIICHTSLAAFFTRLAVLGLKNRPAVCNMVHGYLFDDNSSVLKKVVMTLAEKITAPVTELVITMNRYDFAYAEKHKLAKKVAYVDGVGLVRSKLCSPTRGERRLAREKLELRDEQCVLLYAAEFSGRKSQAVLIEALPLLPENVVLALPGTGQLWQSCKDRAEQLGVLDRVRFPGYCNNIPEWIAAADVVVSASRSEGLPFSVMEAMHAGLPIVASDVKGHQELVDDGVNGFLYPYGDSRMFAERVKILIQDSDLRTAYGEKSAEKVSANYLEKVYPPIMELYESVVDIRF